MSSKLCKEFLRSVNMSGREIRAWAKDPRSKCYSQKRTRDRLTKDHRYRGPNSGTATKKLPSLAKLRDQVAKGSCPTDPDVQSYMRAVINFNKRHGAQAKKSCTEGCAIALRNWGRKQCRIPKTCARKKRDR